MDYERIHKVQGGISPSKLRMKLMGPHHNRKKDGSNNNSARTSPSKLEDSEFVRNSLLATKNGDFNDEVAAPSLQVASEVGLERNQGDLASFQPRENSDVGAVKKPQFTKGDSGNSSAIHPMRMLEDDNLDYDSNASSSSFEFHKGERSGHNAVARSFSRPMPSKWNDAEKWIMNRQNAQANYSKKNTFHNQAYRLPVTNIMRVAPEYATYDHKPSITRPADTEFVDFCQPSSQMAFEKFAFVPSGTHQGFRGNALTDAYPQSKDLTEVGQGELSCAKGSAEDASVVPAIRSVCMRDTGTEMTPMTSQEPSRTATPIGATTPLRSPNSSIPSTPRVGAPESTPVDHNTDDESEHPLENGKRELSEQEIKEKTRREIVALGVQLGKMNIAAWASQDEQEKNTSSVETADIEEPEQIEFEKRAAAWEEVEKSKHAARFKREEIKIQAWESRQKAKLEAEMRRIEAEVEQMRAQAQAKMVKKISMARQRGEEKRAAAEARKNVDAEKAAAQAEYIRQTGRLPSTHFTCCGWL